MLCVDQVFHGIDVGCCVKNVSRSSSSHGVKISGQYYWDGPCLEKILAAIKHVADNFVFRQISTPPHCVHNTVQLQQREILNFLFPELLPSTAQSWTPID